MQCAACAADNPPEHHFCDACGAPLTQRCPQCGTAGRPGARYCGQCGTSLAGAPPVSAAQSAPSERVAVTLAERGLTPHLGRERELNALADQFELAKAGHGQVALVTGEAGIGKTRLVRELRRRLALAGEETTWLEGRCVSFGQAIPFLPVIEQLCSSFDIQASDGEDTISAKVDAALERLGGLEAESRSIRTLLALELEEQDLAEADS